MKQHLSYWKKPVRGMTAVLLSLLLTGAMLPTVLAQQDSVFSYVTDYDYTQLLAGGVDDTIVFSAYADDGRLMMGTLTEEGEQTRQVFDGAAYAALFAPSAWQVTLHGDAGSLCPYAHTHTDHTVCPYLSYDLVTLTYRESGAVLENVYIPSAAQQLLPSGTAHFCWGRYGFVSPATLLQNGDSARVACRGENGKWGVYDAKSGQMLTDFAYADMTAPCGDYVKVSDGEKWGRLDLTEKSGVSCCFDTADSFSITEEIRKLDDGKWQVFNADNEPVSIVFQGDYTAVSYQPETHLCLLTASDGTKSLRDLRGEEAASFTALQTVRYLQENTYAVEQYAQKDVLFGMALAVVNGSVTPEQTVLSGDVNLSGTTDSADVRLLMCYTIGDASLTARQLLAANVNADETVDTTDARRLLYILSRQAHQ